jgi:hypothetical protein
VDIRELIQSLPRANPLITDCHVHIQPFELLLSPSALELMKKHQPDFDRVMEFTRSPKTFLKYMDKVGLDRAVLINAAAPEVTGYPAGLNAMAANYAKEDPPAADLVWQLASAALSQPRGGH